jgi:hypothetical protein
VFWLKNYNGKKLKQRFNSLAKQRIDDYRHCFLTETNHKEMLPMVLGSSKKTEIFEVSLSTKHFFEWLNVLYV